MDASSELHLKNKNYLKQLKQYVWQAYLNDTRGGDMTTRLFIDWSNPVIQAKIIAKEEGTFCGLMEAHWFLKKIKIQIKKTKKEGIEVKKGDVVMSLEGSAESILMAERTLLNLIQRMSGIATAAQKLSSKLPKSIKLLATRKTFWGDLDKRAVSIGGGSTHRLSLSDAILIKENHISITKNLEKSLKKAFKKSKKVRFIEVEIEDLDQLETLISICMSFKKLPLNLVVMLDNFKPSMLKRAILLLKPLNCLIEVSGGISQKNIKHYTIKGVSAISSGAITNKAGAIDFSLLF